MARCRPLTANTCATPAARKASASGRDTSPRSPSTSDSTRARASPSSRACTSASMRARQAAMARATPRRGGTSRRESAAAWVLATAAMPSAAARRAPSGAPGLTNPRGRRSSAGTRTRSPGSNGSKGGPSITTRTRAAAERRSPSRSTEVRAMGTRAPLAVRSGAATTSPSRIQRLPSTSSGGGRGRAPAAAVTPIDEDSASAATPNAPPREALPTAAPPSSRPSASAAAAGGITSHSPTAIPIASAIETRLSAEIM